MGFIIRNHFYYNVRFSDFYDFMATVLSRLYPFLDYPVFDYPVVFGGFSKKCFLLFLSEIHFGPCYAFLCLVKVPKINILMCKTLRAWQKEGRKRVPSRSKRLMRDFKVLRIHQRVKNGIHLLSGHFRLSGRIL